MPSLICGALALVFGYLARQELATGRYSPGSQGMNLAGMICGAVGLLLSVIYWILLAIGVAVNMSQLGQQPGSGTGM